MKRQCIFAAFILLVALILCACNQTLPTNSAALPEATGNEQETEDGQFAATAPPAASSAPTVVRLNMATGGTGGTYYPYGWSLALAIAESTGYIKTTVNATGASVENLQQMANGLTDLAIVQNDVLDYAFNGTHVWTEEPVQNVSTLMSLYPEYCQLIVATDAGIECVEDLRGHNISAGDIGSGVKANAVQILEAHDLTLADMNDFNLDYSNSAQALEEGIIDAFFVTSGIPNTAVMELSTKRDITIINIADDKIEELIEKYPFYAKVSMSKHDYSFLIAPINTVAVQATLVASLDLDEQVAYDIVKTLLENKESIRLAHAKAAFIAAEYAVQGVSVDFHPGARRYFEEIGVL